MSYYTKIYVDIIFRLKMTLIQNISPVSSFLTRKDLAVLMPISHKFYDTVPCYLYTGSIPRSLCDQSSHSKLRFPTPLQITQLSVLELQEIAHINFYILLGVTERLPTKLPDACLGFHGTTRENRLEIFASQHSGKEGEEQFLYMTGYTEAARTTPMKFLGSLHATARKAMWYGDDIVISQIKFNAGGVLKCGSISPCRFSSPMQKYFFSVIQECEQSSELLEFKLKFDATNFSERVIGSFTTQYPGKFESHYTHRSFTVDRVRKGEVMQWLRMQELVAYSFQLLGLFDADH